MVSRRCFAFILVSVFSIALLSQEVASSADFPFYGEVAALNLLLPGSAQLAVGKTLEGWIYVGSSTALVAGGIYTALLSHAKYADDPAAGRRSLETYLSGCAFYAGFAVYAYSSLDFFEDWRRSLEPSRTGLWSFPEILASPFDPATVFSPGALAPLSLTAACIALAMDEDAWNGFWNAEGVEAFSGYTMPPGTAFVLRTAASALGSLFAVAGSELLFRGLVREREGPIVAFCLDSGSALAGFIAPGASGGMAASILFERVAWASYAEILARIDGGLSRTAIAAGFWMRTLLSAAEFILDPGSAEPLRINLKLSFD